MKYLWTFFCGLCMGTADLVPGISGGTMAFVMGFYEKLLDGIKNPQKNWRFLVPLISGIACAIGSLAGVLHMVLDHPDYHVYLYSLFIGLILASTVFCAKQIGKWELKHFACLLVGIAGAYTLTNLPLLQSYYQPEFGFDPWIAVCGAIAISAMLLPGISGSYLLTIFGVYPAVIRAVSYFVSALKVGRWDEASFYVLLSILVGIVVGALIFSRVVSWLFKKMPDITIALLVGFMLGAMRTVWPFEGMPAAEELSLPLAFTVVGFATVFAFEWVAKQKALSGA